MCTSAGWAETFMAIANEEDCDPPDDEIGYPGNCGIYPAGVAYIVLYLVLAYLVIVNMYIAVILENYTQVRNFVKQSKCFTNLHFKQARDDVQDGITDEDYDTFYETWQEFDPNGTQYIKCEHLSEFLDVLEPPLQIAMPNKYKIISMDVPIVTFTDPRSGEVQDNSVFCADLLDIITQDFFARKSRNNLMEETGQQVEGVKVSSKQLMNVANY